MKIRNKVLCAGFNRDGSPAITMWSNPLTIYKRANGTWYISHRGKRITVQERADGTFYLATHQPPRT